MLVVSRVGLEGEKVVAAFEHVRQGGKVERDLLRKIESLADRFGDEYLRLDATELALIALAGGPKWRIRFPPLPNV